MKMNEEFLYYLWSLRLLNGDLQTTQGQTVKIIHPGERNTDSGPDFYNARVKIGDTEWAGNVEMHSIASDWLKHNHQLDHAYDSVILHVVDEADMQISNSYNELIPTLSIKGHYPEGVYFRYKKLIAGRDWIPCAGNIKEVSDLVVFNWLDRILIERLERKSDFIESVLNESNHHWEEAFYISLARSFGFNTNSQPFEQLARTLSTSVLNKHKDNVFQIEALLFGQAGLLNPRLNDDYCQALGKEFNFLAAKYKLNPVKSWAWKFMRMRPVNFPTIRIAQFAQLISNSGHLLSKVLEINKIEKLQLLFNVDVNDYWLTHYTFGKVSKSKSKNLGSAAFDLILINTIVPFLFVYGRHHSDQEIVDRALLFLQQTKAETNGIIKRWAATGVKASHAGQSQALLFLKNEYCTKINCLNCSIGNFILKPNIE
jgi:hypothetical protein